MTSDPTVEIGNIGLQALRFFGEEGPIAIINYLGQRKAYTMDGINALLTTTENSQQRKQLVSIKQSMLQARTSNYESLDDVGLDDVSGQQPIF